MKKGTLLLLFLCCLCSITFAQKNKDFILTLHKDTIFGKIKFVPESTHITFTHKRKRIHFHPKTLDAFGILSKNGTYRFYKSITSAQGVAMFVEVIDQGPVKLYKYRKRDEIAKSNFIREFYFIGRNDEKLVTMTPDSYERTMKVLVKDHPKLLNKMDKVSYQEVPQIIASYNQL